MAFQPDNRPVDDYEFTFESYLDDSSRIEPDPNSNSYDAYDSQSLTDSIAKFQEEFGRTYHSYHAGSYHFPNDPTESERLDEQYEVIKMAMDGHLHLCPFSRQQPPQRVLDIATGTGTWAIEIGDQYPEAQIIGTDLSPIQPPFVPPNVRFFVEDSTEDWDYPELFDFIHTRITIGCWTDMQRQIIQRAYDHLQPGGWLECQEIPAIPGCDDGTMAPDNPFLLWSTDIAEASERANRPANVGAQLKDWLREVGFVDVQETVFKLPVGGWPKEIRLKHIGMLWQRNLLEGLSGLTLRLFHHFLGRSVGEIELSLVNVRKSLFDRKVHAYHKLYVVWGRKPEAA